MVLIIDCVTNLVFKTPGFVFRKKTACIPNLKQQPYPRNAISDEVYASTNRLCVIQYNGDGELQNERSGRFV